MAFSLAFFTIGFSIGLEKKSRRKHITKATKYKKATQMQKKAQSSNYKHL